MQIIDNNINNSKPKYGTEELKDNESYHESVKLYNLIIASWDNVNNYLSTQFSSKEECDISQVISTVTVKSVMKYNNRRHKVQSKITLNKSWQFAIYIEVVCNYFVRVMRKRKLCISWECLNLIIFSSYSYLLLSFSLIEYLCLKVLEF